MHYLIAVFCVISYIQCYTVVIKSTKLLDTCVLRLHMQVQCTRCYFVIKFVCKRTFRGKRDSCIVCFPQCFICCRCEFWLNLLLLQRQHLQRMSTARQSRYLTLVPSPYYYMWLVVRCRCWISAFSASTVCGMVFCALETCDEVILVELQWILAKRYDVESDKCVRFISTCTSTRRPHSYLV